jgi:Bacterial Ig domain
MGVRRWRRGLVPPAAGVAALALPVSGCTVSASAAKPAVVRHMPAPPAQLTLLPAAGEHVRPDKGVTVAAMNSKITKVTVQAGRSSDPGVLDEHGSRWRTGYSLEPGTKYKVMATAVNKDGKAVTETAAFTTVAPAMTMTPGPNIPNGSTVGVGEPIVIQFDHRVASKAAVERSLVLKTSKPVMGAWSWLGSQEVDFRPKSHWPAYTRVHLAFHAAGLRATDGAYVTRNVNLHFSIGASQITVVNTRTHRLRYYLNGKLHWNWPESNAPLG